MEEHIEAVRCCIVHRACELKTNFVLVQVHRCAKIETYAKILVVSASYVMVRTASHGGKVVVQDFFVCFHLKVHHAEGVVEIPLDA